MRSQRRRSAVKWAITCNNYTEEQLEEIKAWAQTNCQFIVIGKETAPTTGTKHLQIFIHLHKKLHGSTICNLPFFKTAHIEVARGTNVQNRNYCIKEGDWWQFGEVDPKKKTWNGIIQDYRTMTFPDFVEEHPKEALLHLRNLEQIKCQLNRTTETWNGDLKEKNIWIWGAPGTGKSKWARNQMETRRIYLKGPNKWWNGFENGEHNMVLFEDFPEDGKYLAQYLKIWADRYCFTAELKGSSTLINPGRYFLIVTSNYSIDQVFQGVDAEALKRRFTEINVMGQNDIFLSTQLNKEVLI